LQVKNRPANWVFLGDSLTEGVGSRRISYVTELVPLLSTAEEQKPEAERRTIHEFRLRQVNPETFNRFARFNLAGYWNSGDSRKNGSLWLWNLAVEGRTIEADQEWLPLIENLRAELVVIYRGSLESIVRPAMVRDGEWPWWVPRAWRHYAAMDPRCYFSTTWWRRAKQVAIDRLKQATRHHLLRLKRGSPLMDEQTLITHYRHLLESVRGISGRVLILGLMPPDGTRFPGSPEHFGRANELLRGFAAKAKTPFFDWAPLVASRNPAGELWYRDGFHPNHVGAKVLADALHAQLQLLSFTTSQPKL
jgi:lysophospholipase L1-like esterase